MKVICRRLGYIIIEERFLHRNFEKEPTDSAIEECIVSKLQRSECQYVLFNIVHIIIF